MADIFEKDPLEVIDYLRDWAPDLTLSGNDTIATSTWIVPTGITMDDESHTTTTATIWLSGGTLDADYDVVNEITTVGGRTLVKTLRFRIRAK